VTAACPSAHPVAVDDGRLLNELAQLGELGRGQDAAVSRVAFTPTFMAGRALVDQFMRASGLTTWTDAAGNLFGRSGVPRPGPQQKVFMVGSHLDTVPDGGLLDGAYGVLAALAALRSLIELSPGRAERFVLVGFCNEEGAFGTAGMTGSRAVAGALGPEELARRDNEGVLLSERLAGVAGPGSSLLDAVWSREELAGYLELHIEQGAVLESLGAAVGVVTAITGRTSFDVEVTGAQGHAGTTPTDRRADALCAAAEVVLAVEALATVGQARVATIGGLTVTPNARNSVPGSARLLGELRDDTSVRMGEAIATLRRELAEVARRRSPTEVTMSVLDVVEPTPTDPGLRSAFVEAMARRSLPMVELTSGAGHDAQAMARLAPVAMLFVPSRAGVSHAAAEFTSPEQLVLGTEVLAGTLALLSGVWGPRG
jgi:N-carbamoyl-L-amino-acid hydrolase